MTDRVTPDDLDLVPRFRGEPDDVVRRRRQWLENRNGVELPHVGSTILPADSLGGNIENPIGAAQVPIGLAGPLLVNGEHADGVVYVPLATTEGALVRSYERGMMTLSRAGGVTVRLHDDRNRISPLFVLDSVAAAHDLARRLPEQLDTMRREAEATTSHGRLLAVRCRPIGTDLVVEMEFATGDAHGMNMIARAAERMCEWIVAETPAERYLLFSGAEGEKKATADLLRGGKGKHVVAGASVPADLLRTHLRVTPDQLVDLWHRTVVGSVAAGTVGYNGHAANGLTALFIACGQDVANVVNAVAITRFGTTVDGDLDVSITLPSLTVATVGGGTHLATARECLDLLGCLGAGRAPRLAEIAAATALAGELSFGAAIATGEMVAAHERYGRNRPPATEAP